MAILWGPEGPQGAMTPVEQPRSMEEDDGLPPFRLPSKTTMMFASSETPTTHGCTLDFCDSSNADDDDLPLGRPSRRSNRSSPRFVTQLTGLSADVLKCMTFADPELRRGLPVSNALAGFGRLLADSRGSEQTYNMSEQCQRLSVFISHNWSMGRLTKFSALCFHFCFWRSLVCSVVAACLVGTLAMTRALPLPGHVSCYCSVVSYVVFNVTMCCSYDVLLRCGVRGPVCFLDKACINQSNHEEQQRGIQALSAFLSSSDELLIVYSDVYLRKLWTVYELASMLIMQPLGKITVVPDSLVKLVHINHIAMTVGTIFLMFFVVGETFGEDLLEEFDLTFMLALVPACLVVVLLLRRWARRRAAAFAAAREFTITSARCAVESDREVVYENVSNLMFDARLVSSESEEEDALAAFDRLARELIPRYLEASFGKVGLPSHCAIAFALPLFAMVLDLVVTTSWDGSTRKQVALAATLLSLPLAIAPLWLAAVSWLSGHCLALRGFGEAAYVVAAWLFTCSLTGTTTILMGWLHHTSVDSWFFCFLTVLLTGLGTALSFWIYRCRRFSQEEAPTTPCTPGEASPISSATSFTKTPTSSVSALPGSSTSTPVPMLPMSVHQQLGVQAVCSNCSTPANMAGVSEPRHVYVQAV